MSSVYTDLADLVQLRFKARNLQLFRNILSKSQLAGGIQSPFKGRGIDFDEVRAYQPGDDIRSIDWRVTARRSKPHTKIFREERERPVLIVLDQSHSLFFGSQLNFKSVTACESASILAWATLLHGDRIGGVIFNEKEVHTIRPKCSKVSLMHFFRQSEKMNKALHISSMPATPPSGYLSKALHHARRVSHPGTQLFVISDFKNIDIDAIRVLSQLKRHCEVMAIQVSDPLETDLPDPACYVVTNGTHRYTLDSRQISQRHRFREQQKKQMEQLQSQLNEFRIPLAQLCSGENTADQLLSYFSPKKHGSLRGTANK